MRKKSMNWTHQTRIWPYAIGLVCASLAACGSLVVDEDRVPGSPQYQAASLRHIYYTGGVHNDKSCIPHERCIHKRSADEPKDPLFPKWWVSDWTMYRVFNNYTEYPPPYSSPPQGLSTSDYQVSYGKTFYDSTYVPADKDGQGAMMEFYDKFCLPIFPSANNYTCAFVSLGNKAYFLRYNDRPADTPACCQFSLHNHPPRQDFIKHLPYSHARSEHLGRSVWAYAREVGPHKILFGYSFNRATRPEDPGRPDSPQFHQPQSFFFSGSPTDPPNAPIVSQNYENFRVIQPDPKETWNQVAQMCPPNPGWCCLFEGDCPKDQKPILGTSKADWSKLDATPAPR